MWVPTSLGVAAMKRSAPDGADSRQYRHGHRRHHGSVQRSAPAIGFRCSHFPARAQGKLQPLAGDRYFCSRPVQDEGVGSAQGHSGHVRQLEALGFPWK